MVLKIIHFYLHNKHVLGSSLKVHPPLPFVEAQRLLLGAHGISSVQDDEDICICAGREHVTRKYLNLIRNNCINKDRHNIRLHASDDKSLDVHLI